MKKFVEKIESDAPTNNADSADPAEIQANAIKKMIGCIGSAEINEAIRIKKESRLSYEIIESQEMQDAVKKGLIVSLRRCEKDFTHAPISDIEKIKESFWVSPELIQSPDIQDIAKQELINCFALSATNYSSIDNAFGIIKEFCLPQESIQ